MITKKDLKIGMLVEIKIFFNEKERTVRGYILEFITKGNAKKIKVKLTNNEIGYVDRIIKKEDIKHENFIFYNKFIYSSYIYAIWERYEQKFLVHNENEAVFLFIFSDKEKANNLLMKINNKNYMVKEIKNNHHNIVNIFKKTAYTHFLIDNERSISQKNMLKWQELLKK